MVEGVTIIGAGPYGLSLAAHLEARNVSYRIIGTPMKFWQSSMPNGMSLKSEGCASSLFDANDSFPLSKYCAEENIPYADLGEPVKLKSFISYGLAFQERFVPQVEERIVTSVGANGDSFSVSLDDGHAFTARKVVIAVGVGYFAFVPPVFSDLEGPLITHSSQHSDLSRFIDQDVAIVGAGASALDLAALLSEVGARPLVITRGPSVEFHERQRYPRPLSRRLQAPSSGIGPGWPSWLYCRAPLPFHYLPERLRLDVTKTRLGPIGCWFTKDAVIGKVPIIANAKIVGASAEDGRVCIRLSIDGMHPSEVNINHVIAATGYRVDVGRIGFLGGALRERIASVEGTPKLSSNFETSVQGLYFVGPAAANSFGPLQRFVVGAKFAARRVSRNIAISS